MWYFLQALVAFAVWSALYATGAFPKGSYAPAFLAACAAFGVTAATAWLIDWLRLRRLSRNRAD